MDDILSVRIPADVKKRLAAESKAAGIPVGRLVRNILLRRLRVLEFRRISETIIPYAPARGIGADEDVSKTNPSSFSLPARLFDIMTSVRQQLRRTA